MLFRFFVPALAIAGHLSGLLLGETAHAATEIKIQRAAENQVAIQVKSAPNGEADALLLEAQGYVHAQDRFLQMDLMRRSGRGRLAELLGEGALGKDLQAHAVGLPATAELKVRQLGERHPEVYRLLEAYVKGVNRFLGEMETKNPQLLGTYRAITRNATYRPAPWELADSVAVVQNQTFFLSSQLEEKISLGLMAYSVTPTLSMAALVTKMLDLRPTEPTYIVPSALRPEILGAASKPSALESAFRSAEQIPYSCQEKSFPFPECGKSGGRGSNNWVVSRGYAKTDTALLANDPHLPLHIPMLFYEMALDSKAAGGTFYVRGFSLAGAPAITIGHNADFGWGMTNLGADVDDVYIETVVDKSKTKFKQQLVAIKNETLKISIRKADGSVEVREKTLRIVPHHGPVFSDYFPEVSAALEQLSKRERSELVASYRWTGHEGSDDLAAIIGVNRAKSYAEVRQSLQSFKAGAQNVVYADKLGNIGYYAHGNFPLRPYAEKAPPYLPAMGDGSQEWMSHYRPEIPTLYNPRSGRIVTANNDPWGGSVGKSLSHWRDYLGYGFDTGARAQRITELLESIRKDKGKLEVEDMIRIQRDHKDLFFGRMVGLLTTAGKDLTEKLPAAQKEIYDALVAWDLEFDRKSEGAVLAEEWYRNLVSSYLKATMPAGLAGQVQSWLYSSLITKTIYNKLNDGLKSDDPATTLAILDTSLQKTAESVEAKKLKGKRWGQLHGIRLSSLLDSVLPVPKLSFERDGWHHTVDVAGSYGANFRMVLAVDDKGIRGKVTVPGGNYDQSSLKGFESELGRWNDYQYRDLVPFLE